MRFIRTFFVNEFKRNIAKILLSIVITLILFMSAFTLCNLASALPSNFYNYYEEYYKDDITISVRDADKALWDKVPEYFDDYKLNSNVENWQYFNYGDKKCSSKLQISPSQEKFLHGMAVDSKIKFFTETDKLRFWENSINWNDEIEIDETYYAPFTQRGVWLSNVIANELGITSDDLIAHNELEFEILGENNKTYTFAMRILGVYYYDEASENLPVRDLEYLSYFYMNTVEMDSIYLETHSKYKVIGSLNNVEDLYELYNYLGRSYELDESYVMDMVTSVKNAEIICGIIGAIMLIGGLIIMLNFLSMFISSNAKNIGLYCALGTRQIIITLAYLLIFFIMISVACAISWSVLPIYNVIVEAYCASVGYEFSISINYGVIASLFAGAYAATGILMVCKHWWMKKTMPTTLLKEED